MLLGVCCVSLATLATAQPQNEREGKPDEVEEIIVTGERVNRTLRDTPSSVVVTRAEAIEAMAATDRVEQVLAMVPNVQLGTGGQGPTIRGQDTTGVLQDLPAFLGGTRPRATLQVDGRGSSYNEFVFGIAPLWDVKQVEVFRSPQTTAQGRNSIAGAIIIKTEDPGYVWRSRWRAIRGNFGTLQGSAMLTGPLVDEQLAFRLAADARRSRTSSEIADRLRGADPNIDWYGLIRLKLLAEPRALPGLTVLANYVHSQSRMPQIVSVRAPFRARRDPLATYGVFENNVDSVTADIRQAIGDRAELVAIASAGDTSTRRFAPPGLGEARSRSADLWLEAFASWRGEESSGRAGLHVLRTKLDQEIDITALRRGKGSFNDLQRSLGLFGEVTLSPLRRLSLTLGARYQQDDQRRTGMLGGPRAWQSLNYHGDFSAWLPKVSGAYHLNDQVTVGLQVQKAYNPGGATLLAELGELDTFGAEQLWNYEGFVRGAFLGNALSISGNVFLNRMRDAQRPLRTLSTAPGGAQLIVTRLDNAPAAKSYGAELEVRWQLSSRLDVRASGGLLRTRIDEARVPDDPILGNEFARAPKFSGSAAIDWHVSDKFRFSGQLRHHSRYFSNDANTRALRIGRASVIDARAAYALGPLNLFAYARNLTDSFDLTYLFNTSLGTAGDPREIGLGLEARF